MDPLWTPYGLPWAPKDPYAWTHHLPTLHLCSSHITNITNVTNIKHPTPRQYVLMATALPAGRFIEVTRVVRVIRVIRIIKVIR